MKKLDGLLTISNVTFTEEDVRLEDYKYQKVLTEKLSEFSGDFSQEIINEIILWKINRYFELDTDTIALLNQIVKSKTEIDVDLTRDLLTRMLNTSGIRLPMASTILRFKNPHIYQIIDQRAYRFLTGNELKTSFKTTEKQIEYYFDYLTELREKCSEKGIPSQVADQILYQMDKKKNKNRKIKT